MWRCSPAPSSISYSRSVSVSSPVAPGRRTSRTSWKLSQSTGSCHTPRQYGPLQLRLRAPSTFLSCSAQSPDSACLSGTPFKLHPKPVQCSTLETQGRPGSPPPPACTGTAGWEAWGCWSGSCPSAHGWMWKSGPTTAGTGGGWAERDSTEKKRGGQ